MGGCAPNGEGFAVLPDPDPKIDVLPLVPPAAAPNGEALPVLPAAANGEDEDFPAAANGEAAGLLDPNPENGEAAGLSPVGGAPNAVLD